MKRKKGRIALMCPFQVKIDYKWNGVSWEGNTLCMYIYVECHDHFLSSRAWYKIWNSYTDIYF